MVEEIRNLRLEIDGLAQLTESLKPIKLSNEQLSDFYSTEEFKVEIIKNTAHNSQEIKNAVESLYMSKCWLGKSLKHLDVPNPYKNDGKRKEVSDIEPTADVFPNLVVAEGNIPFPENYGGTPENPIKWVESSHIEKVDWLRQEIDKLDELLMTMNYNGEFKITDFFFLCYNNARTYLNEARFHLGFELQRLREENKEVMK